MVTFKMIVRKYLNTYLKDTRGATIFEKAILLVILGVIILTVSSFLSLSKSESRLEMITNDAVPLIYKNKNADSKDTAAFEQAVEERTLTSFVEYAKSYPKGKYMTEANDFAYGLAKKESSINSYDTYLDNFSNVLWREDAQNSLSSIIDRFIFQNKRDAEIRKKNLTSNKLSEGCERGDCNNRQGVYIYSSGDKYEGNFKNGVREGRGRYDFSNGGIYNGYFKDGKYEGLGVEYYSDGARYVGQFKNDQIDGQGRFRWPNGEEFDGHWENGKRNGEGIQYNSDGTVQHKGEWVQGELN